MKKNNLLLKTNRICKKWILQCISISAFLIFSISLNITAQSTFVENNNNCETVINNAVFYEDLTTSVLGLDIQSLHSNHIYGSVIKKVINQINQPEMNMSETDDEKGVELDTKNLEEEESGHNVSSYSSYVINKEETIYYMRWSI